MVDSDLNGGFKTDDEDSHDEDFSTSDSESEEHDVDSHDDIDLLDSHSQDDDALFDHDHNGIPSQINGDGFLNASRISNLDSIHSEGKMLDLEAGDSGETDDTVGELPGCLELSGRFSAGRMAGRGGGGGRGRGLGRGLSGGPGRGNMLLEKSTRSNRVLIDAGQKFSPPMVDLETGKEGKHKAQCARIRKADECMPQCRRRRNMRKFKERANPFWYSKKDEDEKDDTEKSKEKMEKAKRRAKHSVVLGRAHLPLDDQQQFKLFNVDTKQTKLGFEALYEEGDGDHGKFGWCCGFHPNQFVTSYLFWAFRSSFMAVLLSAAVWFSSLTFIFGWFIYFIGRAKPQCIHVNGEDFGTEPDIWTMYMDAYSLSWNTFSTVGYGLVYPATSATVMASPAAAVAANVTNSTYGGVPAQNIIHCTGITVLVTLESFVGILIASFWGAIFLSKVTRVSSFAQVTFCDPLVLRYGAGAGTLIDDDDDEAEAEGADGAISKPKPKKLPLPVIEFRVLNRLHEQSKGEIMDATMNIVASVDEVQLISAKGGPKTVRRKAGKKGKAKRRINGPRKNFRDEEEDKPDMQKTKSVMLGRLLNGKRESNFMDPDFAITKSFAKLEIESQEHPFFKRTWLARHILNEESPLLRPEVKELISLNDGHWPIELNDPEKIRKSIGFDQIIVSLSGTSNADANSVYAQKIYDYVDLCVGYRFVDLVYKRPDGIWSVDDRLLNDVIEQIGGGGEDLHARTYDDHVTDIYIL